MPYSITTKDGITINNIPDDVAPDAPELKQRVAAIRSSGGQQPAPETTAAGVVGAVTRGLALPATGAALGAAAGLPFGGVGAVPGAIAGAGAATLAGLVGDPIVGTINNLFGTKYTMPTEAMEDLLTRIGVPEARTQAERIVQATAAGAAGAGGTVAAGRAIQAAAGQAAPVTAGVGRMVAAQPGLQVAGGAGAGAAGQTAQEMGAGTGGQIAATIAGAMAPVGVAAVRQAARRPAQRPAAAPVAERIEPTITPEPQAAPMAMQAMPKQAVPQAFDEVGALTRKAASKGIGSTAAQAKLADLAQVNPEARAAAERLGMDLPFDVFSDNPQVRAAVGLTRSVAGGEAEAAWVNTVRNAVTKADDVVQQFDAAFIEGRPAPGATSQRILDSLKGTRTQLLSEADDLYKQVDSAVPKSFPASTDNLAAELSNIKEELGSSAANIKSLKKLEDMVNSGMTYGGVSFEKSMLGAAKRAGTQNAYSTNLNIGTIKRLEAALAKDQLDTVEAFGGTQVRQQLRAANLLTAKQKALEDRIVGAFGKEIDGSVSNLMKSAIQSASKGDAAQFNKLMKVVPPELRKETVATALASVASSARAGQEGAFGFAEFAKTYRGLRANPPVYKQMVDILGKESDSVLRDLYEISRRITDARAQVLTTGKANQALVESMKAENLVGKVMQSGAAQRAVGAAASMLGPVGGAITPDIVKFMATGKDSLQAAGKLFASDDFQKLAIEAATKTEVSPALIRRTAMSETFRKFADAAKLPQGMDAHVQWLKNAIEEVSPQLMQATIQAGRQTQPETE